MSIIGIVEEEFCTIVTFLCIHVYTVRVIFVHLMNSANTIIEAAGPSDMLKV